MNKFFLNLMDQPGSVLWARYWDSSWMSSRLLLLWQNGFLCKTIRMKMHVTCTFILLKIQFLSEMFCRSIRSKKEANSDSKVNVKSAYEPSFPSGRHLSQVSVAWTDQEYLYSPPPPPPHRWDASPLQGYPAIFMKFASISVFI